jgi:hypothetical protein
VIDANSAAEQILQWNDGLQIHNGRIEGSTIVATAELLGLIALAARDAAYEMGVAVTRRDRSSGYIVTVISLPAQLGFSSVRWLCSLSETPKLPQHKERRLDCRLSRARHHSHCRSAWSNGRRGSQMRLLHHDEAGGCFSSAEEVIS